MKTTRLLLRKTPRHYWEQFYTPQASAPFKTGMAKLIAPIENPKTAGCQNLAVFQL